MPSRDVGDAPHNGRHAKSETQCNLDDIGGRVCRPSKIDTRAASDEGEQERSHELGDDALPEAEAGDILHACRCFLLLAGVWHGAGVFG